MSANRLELLNYQLPEAFSSIEQKSTFEKITLLEELPTFEETQVFIRNLSLNPVVNPYSPNMSRPDRINLKYLCQWVGIYLIPNLEFMDKLATELQKLDVKGPVIEIASGTGKLSWHLKKRGIDIHATDMWQFSPHVEAISAHNAIEKYKPKLVISAYVDDSYGVNKAVADPNVDFVIDIGEGEGKWQTEDNGYDRLYRDNPYSELKCPSRFAVGWQDEYRLPLSTRRRKPSQGVMEQKTGVYLFEK